MRATFSGALTTCACAAAALGVSGCGGAGGGEPATQTTWSLEVTCATDPFSRPAAATFLVRLRSSDGRAPDGAVPVAVAGAGPELRLTIPAGKSVWVEDVEGIQLSMGREVRTTVTLGGQALEASCIPAVSPSGLSVRASAECGTTCATVPSWTTVPDALFYRAEVSHPAGLGGVIDPVTIVTTRTTTLPTAAVPGSSVVRVTAWTFDPDHLGTSLPAPRVAHARTLVTSRPPVGFGSSVPRWALYGPDDFVGGVLEPSLPASMPGERLAVLLVSAGAPASATVAVSGTSDPRAAGATPAAGISSAAAALADAAVVGVRDAPVPAGSTRALAVGDRGSFCVQDLGSPAQTVRSHATVRHVSTKGVFWVADESLADVDAFLVGRPDLFTHLGAVLDDTVIPMLSGKFGPVTDVDGDGRVAVVIRHIGLDYTGWTPIPGLVSDASPDCSGTGQNRADMVQFTDPQSVASSVLNVLGLTSTPAQIVEQRYPELLAHELAHLVEVQAAGLTWQTARAWVVEGLAMLSQDFLGTPTLQADAYLREFRRDSLTGWNATGSDAQLVAADYGGVALLMHLVRERIGDAFALRLTGSGWLDSAAFERATGFPLELALVHLATTAVFSNETGTPAPWADLTDPLWAPLHVKHGPVSPTPLTSGLPVVSTVQIDGWDALVTGTAATSPVTLTVTASGQKPWVIVARY